MGRNRNRVTKTLFHFIEGGVKSQVQMYMNMVTDTIGFCTSFRPTKHPDTLNFLGRAVKTSLPKVKNGNNRHHVAYDFKRPDVLVVEVTESQHASIHHPKGCKFETYGYSLID